MSASVDGGGRRARPWKRHLLIFLGTVAVVLAVCTPLFIRFAPAFVLNSAHTAISSGVGTGTNVPVNSLYTFPYLASPETAHGDRWLLGGNQDGLYTGGWLDLSKRPDLLTIPDMGSRYHNVELIDPSTGVVIANLKATGTTLIAAPGDATTAPKGTRVLRTPGNQVLLLGRTFVYDNADLPTALALAREVTVKQYTGP